MRESATIPLAETLDRHSSAEGNISSETNTTQPNAEQRRAERPDGGASKTETQGKTRGGWQRRIDKLTNAKRTLEERLAKYEPNGAPQAAGSPEAGRVENKSDKAPDMETVEARAREISSQHRQQEEQHRQRQAIHSSFQRMVQTIQKQNDAAQLAQAANVRMPSENLMALHVAIDEEDDPDAVLLQILRTPNLMKEFAGMSAHAVYRKIGRIAATMGIQQERPQSTAPPPIKPVSGSSARSTVKAEDMSLSEYVKGRNSGRVR